MDWREEEAIEYIKDNLSLIDSNNFTSFYNNLYMGVRGNVTSLLLEAGINPLLYMDNIPACYQRHQKNIESINIPNKIKTIGVYAFEGCTSLTNITIPDSVTSIGGYAFYNCTSLTNITIGNSVTSIGVWAFGGCKSLTSIIIPDGVTSIGDDAFYNCSSLTSVTIGNSVASIGGWAFYYCTSLKTINYKGSKEQWNLINKGPKWKYNSSIKTIHCTDGDVKI